MGSIVVFENVSIDGHTLDPGGEEGFNRDDWRPGSPQLTAKNGPNAYSTTRWVPRPCSWVDAPTIISRHDTHTALVRWLTG
jgi:hypothetical protein